MPPAGPRGSLRWLACLACLAGGAPPAWAQQAGEVPYTGDLGQAIAAILIFLGLLAILGRWAWKPLVAQLRHREESINHALELSQQREREATDLLAHYTARMKAVEAEAADLLAQSRRDAAQAREELLAQARQEARQFMAAAREELQHAKQSALQDIYASTAELSTQIASRVLGKALDADDQDRLLTLSFQEVSRAFKGDG